MSHRLALHTLRTALPRRAVALACLLVVAACDEVPTGPEGGLATPETRAALPIPDPGQTLSGLTLVSGLVDGWDAEVAAWKASWDRSPSRGRELRTEIYERILPTLPSGQALRLAERALASTVDALASLQDHAADEELPLHLRMALDEATRRARDASERMANGDATAALGLALRAGDALREVGPRNVGATLIESGEVALGRFQAVDPYSQQVRARAVRLLEGARAAYADGSHELAIRRAFYACQLLGVELP